MRALYLLLFVLPLRAQERPDLSVIDRIKTEAFDHCKVMDTLYQITDVRGPRLTASPQFDNAANWAVSQLKESALQTFISSNGGRSAVPGPWSNRRSS